MVEREIKLGRNYIGLWPALLILVGVLIGLGIAQYIRAEVTDVQRLTDLLRDKPQMIAEHIIKAAEEDTDTGRAYKAVKDDLLVIAGKISLAESRAHLTEADRTVIKAADDGAVFDAKEVPELKSLSEAAK